jgi:hypothetical protein
MTERPNNLESLDKQGFKLANALVDAQIERLEQTRWPYRVMRLFKKLMK